jgi:hypothetical protein
MKDILDLKEKAVFFGWIAGLLLFISMLWIFTQPLQAFHILRSVNNVFINANDSRRVTEYLPHKSNKAGLLGYWFSMHDGQNNFFVFTFFKDGTLVPLGAVVSPQNTVEEIIPLSAHAQQVFDTLPQSILTMYAKRIEGSAR